MDAKFEYQGYWWLPGADEDEVPGILKFDPDDGATLDLMGSLKSLKNAFNPLEPEIILGLSFDGKLIALKDCERIFDSAIGRGFSTSSLAVPEIFLNEDFERAEGALGSRGSWWSICTWRRGRRRRGLRRQVH